MISDLLKLLMAPIERQFHLSSQWDDTKTETSIYVSHHYK